MAENRTNREQGRARQFTGACFGAFVGMVLGGLAVAYFRDGYVTFTWPSSLGAGALIGGVLGARFPGVAEAAIGAFQTLFP